MSTELTKEELMAEQQRYITKVYGWMSLALVVSAVIAKYTAETPELIYLIFGNQLVFWGLLISEVILVAYLAIAIKKVSVSVATLIFFGYAALNGLTFSVVFLQFTEESLAITFLVTAGTFGLMSAYGYFTKKDLTSIGNLCLMGLLGLIVASAVNIFFYNELLYDITTYIGVLIFIGLTAYDTQKIKKFNVIGNEGTEEDKKESILGALQLYLDFINLFLKLLRLLGKRKK